MALAFENISWDPYLRGVAKRSPYLRSPVFEIDSLAFLSLHQSAILQFALQTLLASQEEEPSPHHGEVRVGDLRVRGPEPDQARPLRDEGRRRQAFRRDRGLLHPGFRPFRPHLQAVRGDGRGWWRRWVQGPRRHR